MSFRAGEDAIENGLCQSFSSNLTALWPLLLTRRFHANKLRTFQNRRPRNVVNLSIRAEAAADVAAIHAVTRAAFLDAPHTAHVEQFIVDALRAAGMLSISLVAEVGGVVVGHVAASPVSISDGSPGWFGLGPVSVAPDYQGRGIGSALVRETLRLLRERDASGCVLVGEPAFYSRFGFEPEEALVLAGVPPEYFQAVSFDHHLPHGIVTFHAAFDARG